MADRPILFSAPMVRAIRAGRKTQTRRILNPQPDHLQHHVWRKKLVYQGEHRMFCWKDLVLENIWDFPENDDRRELAERCPHGVPGDHLWVKETFAIISTDYCQANVTYRERMPHGKTLEETDGGLDAIHIDQETWCWAARRARSDRWRPSIFMPRWASRVLLEMQSVRVQRLQEISEADAIAEGIGVEFLPHDPDNFHPPGSYGYISGIHPVGTGTIWRTAKQAYRELWESINGPTSWEANPFVWAETFSVLEGLAK